MRTSRKCPVCGKVFQATVSNKVYCSLGCRNAQMRKQEKAAGTNGKEGHRRCHDCGKPTTNYRCGECWAKVRKESAC